MLASGALPKGASWPVSQHRRHLGQRLKSRLPPGVQARLVEAGRVAQDLGLSAYVVGGFVRDLLLDRANLDLDLVIEGDGIAFAKALAQAGGGRVMSSHPRFGTAVVVFPDGVKLDVATARSEYYEYPTALPTVQRSSIKKDLYRRDFTINTLAIRLDAPRFGELLDFYGGQRDLHDGVIRVLHSLSFLEDPTRVFRAVRFEQRFGFRLGKETLALIRSAVALRLFDRLSAARLRQEVVLLLSEQDPRPAIGRLAELKLLQFLHPSLNGLRGLRSSRLLTTRLNRIDQTLDWYRASSLNWPVPASAVELWLIYFFALMELLPARAVRETLGRLSIPRRQREKIRLARYDADRILRTLSRADRRRRSVVIGILSGLPDEVLLFLAAKAPAVAITRLITAYLSDARFIRPALTGDDLKAMGLKPGPVFKKVLERLRAARADGEVKTVQEERAFVKKITRRNAEARDVVRKPSERHEDLRK